MDKIDHVHRFILMSSAAAENSCQSVMNYFLPQTVFFIILIVKKKS